MSEIKKKEKDIPMSFSLRIDRVRCMRNIRDGRNERKEIYSHHESFV